MIWYFLSFAAGVTVGVLVTLNNTRKVAQLVDRLEELAGQLAEKVG